MEQNSDNKKVIMDIDQILPHIGEFGKYQRLLEVLLCFMNIPLSYHLLIMYFSTLNPPWVCKMNSTICLLNGTMPEEDDRRCLMPRSEWEYTEPRDYSLVTQFDIHCENKWLVSLLHSIYFVGQGTGAVMLGWIADTYGRKSVLFPCVGVVSIVGLCTAFINNIYLIIFCRFVVGYFNAGTTLQMFIIMSEIVGSKHRALAGLLIYFSGSISLCILTLKAYFVRKWRLLHIICTGPYLFTLLFFKVIPESIRWLQQHGKVDEVMNILRKITHYNRKELPANIKLPSLSHTSHRSNPLDLFRTRKVALSCCVQGFIWMATSTCCYCFYLVADELEGSVYRDQFILIATEIPSLFFAVYFMNRFGRKPTTLIALLMGGTACLAIAFIPATTRYLKIGRIACGILGKLAMITVFSCIYTWSLELFPTNIRAEGMGFLQITNTVGSVSAPWIAKGLHSVSKSAPFIIMGVPPLISAALGMLLPETKMKKLSPTANAKGSESHITGNEIGMEHMNKENIAVH